MEAKPASLVEVMPQAIPEAWSEVRDHIEAACARSGGRYTLADVLALLLACRMQLWVAVVDGEVKGVGLSEIVLYPQLKECRTFAATGEDAHLWEHLIENIEAWGRERGCHLSTCITRPGWERPLKQYGYAKTHIQLEKVIGRVH